MTASGVRTAVPAVACGAIAGALVPSAEPVSAVTAGALLLLLPLAALALGAVRHAAAVTAALCYCGVLAWAYTTYFVPSFAYQGLVDAEPTAGALLVTAAIAALPALWLPLGSDRLSTIAVWSLYLACYVPGIVIPIFLTGELATVLPYDLALLAAIVVLTVVLRSPAPPLLGRSPLSPEGFTRLIVGLGAVSLIYVAATFGVNPLPALGDVYETRAAYGPQAGAGLAGYLIPWSANVVNPLLIGLGIARRRPAIVLLGVSGQMLIYGASGLKSVVFIAALVPLFYLGISLARRSYGLLALVVTPAIIAVALGLNQLTSDWALSLVRRQFATPGQLSWYFFDFFSDHPKYQLSASFLASWVAPPYSDNPPDLIGRVFFPETQPHANTGIWGDAFANFGLTGVIGFTLVFALVLLLLDGVSHRRDLRVAGPVLAVIGLSLSQGALFTTMLTGGLGLAIALIWLMPTAAGREDDGGARAGPAD